MSRTTPSWRALMGKLQVNRQDGKKGSKVAVTWKPHELDAFEQLKAALSGDLEVFQLDPDKPYVLRTDASDWAIGAVLEQEQKGRMVPVGFYSRNGR